MLPMAVTPSSFGGVVIPKYIYGQRSWPYIYFGDTLRISGFMDDVIFAHKLRLLDVTARLRQRGSHVPSLGIGA